MNSLEKMIRLVSKLKKNSEGFPKGHVVSVKSSAFNYASSPSKTRLTE